MIPYLPDNLSISKGLNSEYNDICTLELTVVTGLEEAALEECIEKLNVIPTASRGRVFVNIEIAQIPVVLQLRSIDNVNVILKAEENFSFPDDRDECLDNLYNFCMQPDWRKGLRAWETVFGKRIDDPFAFEQDVKTTRCIARPELDLALLKEDSNIVANLPKEIRESINNKRDEKEELEHTINESNDDAVKNECSGSKDELNTNDISLHDKRRITSLEGPKFRVSCHRVGTSHTFGSPEAARQFGGGINEFFGWPVDLSNHDIEVLLNIHENHVYVAISLTREALFKRNLSFFGPTNLRATICYNMIRLAKLKPGDVVMDPMCGGASIPIEGSLTYPKCMHLGGDYSKVGISRSSQNIDALLTKKNSMNIDVALWNATRLPIRNQCVDVVISDLPFGKRIGSKGDNRVLYHRMLVEAARVTRVNTGRAVFLTHDRNSMIKNLRRVTSLWKNYATKTTTIGGLAAGVFLLKRTGLLSDPKATLDAFTNRKKRQKVDIVDEPK